MATAFGSDTLNMTAQGGDALSTDGLLDLVIRALEIGQLDEGALLMERALALNVEWERLTVAVQEGIARSRYGNAGVLPSTGE